MMSALHQRSIRSMVFGLLGMLAIAGMASAQPAEEDSPKPEIFTREYPDAKQFRLHNFRPVDTYPTDDAVKLPEREPVTTGKSDGQLVDEIEQLRTFEGEPRFVASDNVAVGGVAIAAADITADGRTLLIYDREQRLTTWSLPEGKKLVEFSLNNPSHSAAVAISPDGSKVLFGDASTKVLLLDAQTGQVEFTHDPFNFPVASVAFSAEGTKIVAADTNGLTYVAPPSAAGEIQEGTNLTDGRPIVDVAVADNGTFGMVAASGGTSFFAGKVGSSYTGDFRKPQDRAAVGANTWQMMLADKKNVAVSYKRPDTFEFLFLDEDSTLPGFDIRFDTQNQTAWIATEAGIDIRALKRLNVYDLVRFPKNAARIDLVVMAPDVNLLGLIKYNGTIDLLRLENNRTKAHAEMIELVGALVEEGRFEALELLAERWSGIDQNVEDADLRSLYLFLVNLVRSHKTTNWPEGTQLATFKKFVEENPESEFFRVLLTIEAIKMAWDNRGRGFASGVDAKEYIYFRLNLEEATNMLMPLFQRDQPPCPEAYVQAMELSKVTQWDEEATEYLLAEAMQNAPTYSRIYGEAAVGRMPRWGGAPDASVRLAEKVADAVGGDEGDILYAEIARWTRNYHSWDKVYNFLGFSRERVFEGFVKSVTKNPVRRNLRFNRALIMADRMTDQKLSQQLMETYETSGLAPLCGLWNHGRTRFESKASWALDDKFVMHRIVPRLAPKGPRDFAPNTWESGKVDELDALTRVPRKATFVQGNSFSVGQRRPWKMDVAANGSTAATIDEDGNLTVWDIAAGKSILQLTEEDAPGKGAVAVSHDGKSMVVGTEKGALELRDTDTGAIRFQLIDLENPIVDVGLSSDAKQLYGIDSKNGMHIVRNGEKRNWTIEKLNPEDKPLVDPIAVGINAGGEYLHAKRHAESVEILVMAETDGRVAVQKMAIPESPPIQVASGQDRFIVVAGDVVIRAVITDSGEATYQAAPQRMLQQIRHCELTADGDQFWAASDDCIDIRAWEAADIEGVVKLPEEIESVESIRLAPDGNALVAFDEQGTATVWKLQGDPFSKEYRLSAALDELITNGRYNTLEHLADRWSTREMPGWIEGDKTLYEFLLRRMNQEALRTENAERMERTYQVYLSRHMSGKLTRLARADLKFQQARIARGDTPAEETPDDIRNEYHNQLKDCQNLLSSLIKKPDTPPEAYVFMIRLNRELGAERLETKKLLDHAERQAFEYPQVLAEACVSLLPRYGVQADVAQTYAQESADKMRGKQRDVVYFQIADRLADVEGWKFVFEELKFDRQRVLRGLTELAWNYPRRRLIRTGLQLAHEGDNKVEGAVIAQIIEDHDFVPCEYLWTKEGKSYEEALKWAKGSDSP
ncbi:WD40 repeat domain-containing protein [Blastopirellula marina]|uniref:Uncharacterized protein n=1 Tax=Blastopirellula marina TaxID=124 RepID=A0A2S8GKB3_9BACT|nr:WD40 repeat domain-containing protein [Blastopirellula marina]PQO44872.1 hypothetical protein C5Y93_17425 [Blastopirellula marina]